ncbi:FkbM family methyltransferase [Sulfitobacter sp. F26204]|uniref:FkbM family methyltransferase n=1 Tax=Sulfitobacter sp. F26204 TaxID=2996014 RepID=UPI00225E2D1C|nr:FkbM family methyltransferase [Sulfitobacter sp. F26204]MCX7560119.1 FkbM family methyltransferase [Sulfitobacter sp. F26204]
MTPTPPAPPATAALRPVAECYGIKVPDSPMLTPDRIERINAKRYEAQEIAGALQVVRKGDNVLEMGTGIGLVGAIVAKNAKPEKLMSFEANPALIDHINALYDMNQLGGIIELRNQVLISAPDPADTMALHVHNSFPGSSLIETGSPSNAPTDVPTAQYDTIQNDFSPDVLLIDSEGSELDFLRHAALDGVRALVIAFHPDVYGREGMLECKTIITRAGFSKLPDHCSRLVWTCVRDAKLQGPTPLASWTSDITTLGNAIVVPASEQGFVQAAGILTAEGQYHEQGALWRNGRALTIEPSMPRENLATRKGTWLWGGVLWMHFGHFLVESMARLWALEHLDQGIDGILYIPKRPRNGNEVHAFQRDLVKLLDTDAPIVSIAATERVERLIVPGPGFGLGPMISGTATFRAAIAKRFGRRVTAQGSEKLYISRSKLPSGRGNLIGETDLEARLSEEGYSIYHPEKHDVYHQIATYKAARKVIAAEGSALHMLAMVADATVDVAMIVRRPSGATRNLERHLEAFTGRAPLNVTELIRSWKPRGPAKPRMWMGELNMPALQAALADGGFIGKGGKPWRSLDPQDVQNRLGDKFEEVISKS